MTSPVDVRKDVSDAIWHGTTNLGTANSTSNVVTTPGPVEPLKGIQLKAGVGNSGVVYIGTSGGLVSNNVASPHAGFPMESSDALFLPISDVSLITANNAAANDIIHWIAL